MRSPLNYTIKQWLSGAWGFLADIVKHALSFLLAHLALLALVAITTMFLTITTGDANAPTQGNQECPTHTLIQPL